ncbi:MAG: hypothetical protein ABW090_18015 [Sedimenticola sp.]
MNIGKLKGNAVFGLLLLVITGLMVLVSFFWFSEPPEVERQVIEKRPVDDGPLPEPPPVPSANDEYRPACWTELGHRDHFGSDLAGSGYRELFGGYEQILELKQRWGHDRECSLWGLSWTYSVDQAAAIGLLVADEGNTRLHGMQVIVSPDGDFLESHATWHEITQERLGSMDPTGGITIGRFLADQPLPEKVRQFIGGHVSNIEREAMEQPVSTTSEITAF